MSDITFETRVNWSGIGKQGEGKVTMGDVILDYAGPTEMGGKGSGVSPEDLLISAVTTCYSGTLFAVLLKNKLPVERVAVRAAGTVSGYPLRTKFSRLVVHPAIIGGDPAKQSEYEQAAITARNKCFIGKSIAGNIEYEVGDVTMASEQTEGVNV